MRHTLRVRVGCVIAVLLVGGCASPGADPTPAPSPAESTGSVESVATLLDPPEFAAAARDRVLVNVHVPFEGAIRGTDFFIPYDQIGRQGTGLPADLRTPLALYCRSGRMSAIAAQTLADLGYTDLVELRGGMDAWEAGGRSLLMREQTAGGT